MTMPHLCWDTGFMKNNPTLKDKNYGNPAEVKHAD